MKPNNQEFFNKIAKEFDTHVKQSIPLFSLVQANIVRNIANNTNSKVLDICGSTGELGRQLLYTEWEGDYLCLDGSPEMLKTFLSASNCHELHYLDFHLGGFQSSWKDGKVQIKELPETNPKSSVRDKYDFVVESLGFQFFTCSREKEIETCARLGKTCIFFEKFITDDFLTNEVKKDNWHKSKFFSSDEITDKQKILNKMQQNLVSVKYFENILLKYFNNFVKFAQIGNFAGYIGTNKVLDWELDSKLLVNKFN